MVDARKVLRGSRFSMGRRVPAVAAWITAIAVFFAQGISPSYAGITVTTFGSGDSVKMQVLAWNGGVPTKVASFLPGRTEPVVTDIDPARIRDARWVETRASGGWTQGKLLVGGPSTSPGWDISFRQTSSGLEAIASDSSDASRSLHLEVGRGDTTANPQEWPILLALLVCELMDDLQLKRCFDHAQDGCGKGNVKCASYEGVCGVGRCLIQCQGSDGDCK